MFINIDEVFYEVDLIPCAEGYTLKKNYKDFSGLDQWELSLENLKIKKNKEINQTYEQKASLVKIDTPDSEISTWYIQENEAVAWQDNNTFLTPFIDGLAKARQVDRLELIDKILTKVNVYKTFMGSLTGQRQYFEDLIKLAKTKEEVETIVWE